MFYDNGYFMGGMHGLWWIFWVLLIGVLVFYSWGRPGGRRHGPRETPHEVLQRRLANGEITPEQYEERKRLLDRDKGAAS
ncbi:SHOCT domain-containing protein [Hydrogenophaga sp.]|uniref:SHOCT domain-containing protein n=1 Tax=Hydrogenophaga sp. TaxID=1904254 RepID=UPI0035667BDC